MGKLNVTSLQPSQRILFARVYLRNNSLLQFFHFSLYHYNIISHYIYCKLEIIHGISGFRKVKRNNETLHLRPIEWLLQARQLSLAHVHALKYV